VCKEECLAVKKNKKNNNNNIKASLKFAREHLDKDLDFWNNVLWTDESKVKLFGPSSRRHVWHKPKTAFDSAHEPHTNCEAWGWKWFGAALRQQGLANSLSEKPL